MKNYKSKKGITLIALVITIIILLILAGVTLNFIFNGGIIDKSKQSVTQMEKQEIYEAVTLGVVNIKMKNIQDNATSIAQYYSTKDNFINNSEISTEYKISEYNIADNIVIFRVRKNSDNTYKITINIDTGNISIVEDVTKVSKIIYNLDNGKFEGTAVTSYTEGNKTEYSIPVREGYYFDGWYLKNDFSGEKTTSTEKTTTGDIKLYAKWLKEIDVKYFTFSDSIITGFSNDGRTEYNKGNITELVLPSKNNNVVITSVGNSAFSGCTNILSVKLPKTVVSLEGNAFAGCNGLTQIDSLEHLESIGSYAFENCTSLTGTLIIPKNVTTLKYASFRNTGITKLVIHKNIDTIEGSIFSNCSSLKEVEAPISVDITGGNQPFYSPFSGCSNINKVKLTKGTGEEVNYMYPDSTPWKRSGQNLSVELEDGIVSITDDMFSYCTNLYNIKLPNTLKNIGTRAFFGCSNLENIQLPETLEIISGSAFENCTSLTGTLIIPKNVTTLGYAAFRNTDITKLIINENLQTIEGCVFASCTNLTEIELPISVEITGGNQPFYSPFYSSTNLNKVIFTKGTGIGVNYWRPDSTPWFMSGNNEMQIIFDKGITSIADDSFQNLDKATFYYKGTQEEWANVSVNLDKNVSLKNNGISYNYTESV